MAAQVLKTEVLILGGGAAGVCAAIAAARNGSQVILIESQGCLGGSRTATGVDTFYGFYAPGTVKRRIVGGIAWEMVEQLQQRQASFERPNTYGAGTGVTYNVEELKCVYEAMVLEAGAQILFHTIAAEVKTDGKNITGIVIANKAGLTEIQAEMYIDTTGDGDIAARAGAPFEKGAPQELQSLTTIFFLGQVDVEAARQVSHADMVAKMKEAHASGRYSLPREDGSWHRTPNPGVIQANMVRVSGVDATDPFALSLAEIEGRKQTLEYARFLREQVPGFEDSFLISTSSHIGVRETRRIKGAYILTEEDVVEGAKFDDAIACCAAPVEDHKAGADTRWAYVQGDGYYHIPFRCLLPQQIDNLLVAGRCLSATHGAQASARNSAQCMAMGQAVGTAAALRIQAGGDFRSVSQEALQTVLQEQGALLHPIVI